MYRTLVRPKTEPYEIWKERRRIQTKEIKEYLKGRFIWKSSALIKTTKGLKKIKVQGTYRKGYVEAV